MKSFAKLSVLAVLSFSAIGCANQAPSNSSGSNASTSSLSSISSYVPSIPSKEEGVTLDKFTEEVNKIGQIPAKAFRMTFQITETVVGTYPIYKKNSTELLSEGVYNTTLVVESTDGNLSSSKVVGDRPNTTTRADDYARGVVYTVSGWLNYHAQRRSFLDSALDGEGFKETFYIDSFRMWMVSWGNRPANLSLKGTYFAYDEHERTFDEKGYCKTVYVKEYEYLDGSISRYGSQYTEYHGSYELALNGTIEYLEQ